MEKGVKVHREDPELQPPNQQHVLVQQFDLLLNESLFMCMTTITVAHITNAAMLLVTGSGKQKRYIEFDEEGMVTTSITLGLT